MAWVPGIPLATDFISASQPLILGNFQALDAWSQVDHTGIDTGATDGMHKALHVLSQLNSPDTTAASMIGLVAGLGPVSGNPELFFIEDNLASGALAGFKPWTERRNYTLGGNDGYFYVAGGRILIKYNFVNVPLPLALFPYAYVGGPAFLGGSIPLVLLTPYVGPIGINESVSISVENSTAAGFDGAFRLNTAAGPQTLAGLFMFVSIGIPA